MRSSVPEEAVSFATVRSVLYEPRVTRVYEDLARAFVDRCREPKSGGEQDGRRVR